MDNLIKIIYTDYSVIGRMKNLGLLDKIIELLKDKCKI